MRCFIYPYIFAQGGSSKVPCMLTLARELALQPGDQILVHTSTAAPIISNEEPILIEDDDDNNDYD